MSRTQFAGFGLAVVLAGCAATPTMPLATRAMSASASPASQATPIESIETPAPSSSWPAGALDQKDTTHFEEYRSTGTYVIWSTSARTAAINAPDLFGFQPDASVELLYDNPNRDTTLSPIDGHGSRFTFVESKPEGEIAGPWKLWYLEAPGAKPKLVDNGVGYLPYVALSDRYLVWTIGQGDTEISELKLLDLANMETRSLEREPRDVAVFAQPAIDDSRLVYAVFDDQAHVYYRDVSSNEPAVRVDRSACAAQAAIHADVVVWAECAEDGNQGGRLLRYSLTSQALLPVSMPTIGDLGFVQPSIGDRYVAAWGFTDRMLYLADLQTGTYPSIMDLGPTDVDPHAAVGRPDLQGDLLAYVYWPGAGDAELRWVVLR